MTNEPGHAIRELIEAVDALAQAVNHILHTSEVRQGLGADGAKDVVTLIIRTRAALERAKAAL